MSASDLATLLRRVTGRTQPGSDATGGNYLG